MTDATPQNPLPAAIEKMNAGDWAAARTLVERALAREPGNSIALYLYGLVLCEQKHWAAAEAPLRQALAIDPRQSRIGLQLAHTLRALQRPAEAIALCRDCIAAAPGDPGAWLELARAQEESGATLEAEESYRRLLRQMPGVTQASANLARLLAATGRQPEAETLLRGAIAAAAAAPPQERAGLEQELGVNLKLQRRHDEALGVLDRARDFALDRAALDKARATVLQHLRRFDEAIAVYEDILSRDPLDMEAHLQLNETLYRLGREEKFLRSYDIAAGRVPGDPILANTKGRFLLKLGRAQEAHDVFEQALNIAPDHPHGLSGLARALEALGERGAALAVHEKSVRLYPDNPELLVDCAGILLRCADAARAVLLAERAHLIDPCDQGALAVLGLAQRALGDGREDVLNDYERLVRVFDLEPPQGYADMESFNRDLAAYLDRLHGDAREHFTQTLRGGTRLYDEIFHNGYELVERLRLRIEAAIRRYVADLPAGESHPFLRRRAKGFAYSGSWSSRLADRGFHVNHIHAAGWISSAYYVAVPDAANDAAAKQGWLKFGEPTADFGPGFPARTVIQPKPGRLVLFPSYMWHGTVPFESSQSRMTIAFDVVPRGVC